MSGPYRLCNSRDITNYLNREDIRAVLGVDPSIGNFTSCNNQVNALFNGNLDSVYPTPFFVTGLLERGVKVLVYVGANDFRCNWVRMLRTCPRSCSAEERQY